MSKKSIKIDDLVEVFEDDCRPYTEDIYGSSNSDNRVNHQHLSSTLQALSIYSTHPLADYSI